MSRAGERSCVRRVAALGLLLALAPATTPRPAVAIQGPPGSATLAEPIPFRTDSPHDHRAAPIAAGDLIYLLTPFPHALHALRSAKGNFATAWTFRPEADRRAYGLACCDLGLPGPTAVDGRLYLNTLDGRTVALEAASGRIVWNARTADPARGETLASAPLVAAGRVYLGNAGDDFGVRGWIKALDAATGAELWTRYSTGPDAEVGLRSDYSPGEEADRAPDRGTVTWPSDAWRRGGGGVAGPILHDPELSLIFHGTGHPAPWNPEQRPGDNRWTSGLFARDAATGAARWFVGLQPHDLFAYGATGPLLLIDRDWRGRARKLLVHAGRDGFLTVLDRGTGELLSAEAYVPVTAVTGVDLATGRPTRDTAKTPNLNAVVRDVCPAWSGGTMAGGMAYAAETGLLYLAASRLCMDFEARQASFMPGTAFTGANLRVKTVAGTTAGALIAWDLAAGRAVWTRDERFPLASAPLLLPGGRVAYGTLEGDLNILDARDGVLVWQRRLPSGIVAPPVLLPRPDGRLRLAVVAGRGAIPGASAGQEVDLRDATAARGFGNALRDLPAPAEPGGALYVFDLP